MPQISVIVPVYKVELYLRRCVDSILSQTFTDFELILVDDGSPDNCPSICDEYKEKDSRVVVIHQKNGGLSAARNAGIDWAFANSDSEWLSFVDSDDWIHERYLEWLYSACSNHKVDISIAGFVRTDGLIPEANNQTIIGKVYTPEAFWCENQLNSTVSWAKLYAKKLWNGIRFPVGKIHEDEATTYKLLFQCKQIAVISNEIYYYYQNSNGIMLSKWTPKRLDIIEALEGQVEYTLQNKYINAAKTSIAIYFASLYSMNRFIKDTEYEGQYSRYLRKKFAHALKKYSDYLGFSIRNNRKYYEVAFPKKYKYYLLHKKITKKFNNGVDLYKSDGIVGLIKKLLL